MVRMWKDFWASRKLIWKLARNDFKTRYAGSYFGVLWAMVQPVIIVLVYWFVSAFPLCSGWSAVLCRGSIFPRA